MWISKKRWEELQSERKATRQALDQIRENISAIRFPPWGGDYSSDPITITCLATIGDRLPYSLPTDVLLSPENRKIARRRRAMAINAQSSSAVEKLIAFGFDGRIGKELRSTKSFSMQPDVSIRRIVFFLNAPEDVRVIEVTGANVSGLASPGGVRFGVCDLSLTPANRLTFTVERR